MVCGKITRHSLVASSVQWQSPRGFRGGHIPLALSQPQTDKALLPQLQPFVPKVLCTVCLLRAHCMHYHSPANISRILQEICNFFISLVQSQGQH